MPRAGVTRAGLMRGIKQFVLDKLPEQLSRFEGNISEALDTIDNSSIATFGVVPARGSVYAAKVGEHVRVESAGAVQLPAASTANAGRGFVIIERLVATGVIKVFAAGQQVNGSDPDTLPTAIGAWLYTSTGTSWCRIGRT